MARRNRTNRRRWLPGALRLAVLIAVLFVLSLAVLAVALDSRTTNHAPVVNAHPVTASAPSALLAATPHATDTPTPAPTVPSAPPLPDRSIQAPVPLPTVTPTAGPSPAPGRLALTGIVHEWQTWNNCGPATLAMALSFHGYSLRQSEIATSLRPNPDDKNVSPEELADFARQQGMSALVRVNGEADLMKDLLDAGIPVLVEVWLEPEPENGFGHYRLLTGYDDEAEVWIAHDSYVAENLVNPNGPYQGITVSFDVLERQWRMFNRTYVVIFAPSSSTDADSAISSLPDNGAMWNQALAHSQIELEAEPNDAIAWFNQGTALVALQRFEEAADAYDRAIAIGLPWRMLWYQFGPLEAYYRVGRYEDLISLAEKTLATTGDVEELHYWRGLGLAALSDTERAREAWTVALSLRPSYAAAAEALASLPTR